MHARWLFLLAAVATLAWQAFATVRDGSMDAYRYAVVGIAAGTMVWAARLRRDGEVSTAARVFFAFASALVFWGSVLELSLHQSILLARGVLMVLAAAMLHATLLLAATRRRGSPRGRLALRCCFSLTVLVLLLCGLEAAFRAFMPPHLYEVVPDDPRRGPMIMTGPDSRRVARPGFHGEYVHPEFAGTKVEINAWGMREDADEASSPHPEDHSVLVLGDSFAFGTGVEQRETFHELLEAEPERITQRRLRVYGAGLPGSAPHHQLATLRAVAESTRPDVVVLTVFEGNDFQDHWFAERLAADVPQEVARGGDLKSRELPGIVDFLSGISRFRFWAVTSSLVQGTRLDGLLVNLGLVDPIAHANLFFDQCLLADPPEIVASMRASLVARMVEVRALSESLDAELVLLLIADAVQVDERLFRAYPFVGGTPLEQRSRLGFHQQFVSALEQEGLRFIDTLPTMQAEAVAGRACYHGEGHWNAHGHAIAAALLVPVLGELLLE